MSRARRRRHYAASTDLENIDASLLDLVDHVLTKGVVVTGDLVLGVADIDLVYLRLSAVLCAADRILEPARPPLPIITKPKRSEPAERATMAKRLGAAKLRKLT
jgi:hypothetical protein